MTYLSSPTKAFYQIFTGLSIFLWLVIVMPEPAGAQTPEPMFSVQGGTYINAFDLELSVPEGSNVSAIMYTVNGNEPTLQGGVRYTGPIAITGSRIVRARAYGSDGTAGPIVSHNFSRINQEIQNFSSNLPIVIINHHHVPITEGDRTPAVINIIEPGEDGRARLLGDEVFFSRMDINIRGSSSTNFPKKMYGFHLRDEQEGNRNVSLLGMPREHNWILNGPYTDMTLMRNVVAYRLAEDMGWYSPRTQLVELFVHFGTNTVRQTHYHGVYVLTERIKWDNNRVNITQIEPEDQEEPAITGGYIIKKDRLGLGESGFRTQRGTLLAHVRPAEEDITPQQQVWIRNYMTQFESALYGTSFGDREAGYEAFINVESFIDHFLHTELLKEIDGYRLSTFMYKDRGGKLVMGPVWDYNLSMGIANYLNGWRATGWYYSELRPGNHCVIGCGVRDWYVRLMQDPAYRDRMERRWWELRETVFSDEYLLGMIDHYTEMLEEAQERNFRRWPTLGTYVWPNYYYGDATWQAHVVRMRNFMEQRLAWMDAQMGERRLPERSELLHYWHFGTDLPNNTPMTEVDASWSRSGVPGAAIRYTSALVGYPFFSGHAEWRQASMERRNAPTALNYRAEARGGVEFEEGAMRGLQVREPFVSDTGENEMVLHVPTVGAEGISVSFALMDEGAAEWLRVDYAVTLSGGMPEWTTEGLAAAEFVLSQTYQVYTVDLTGVPGADDNADLRIRLRFDGDDMRARNGNRVTFNNIAVEAASVATSIDRPGPDGERPFGASLDQNYPNPFNPSTVVRYHLTEGGYARLDVIDVTGRVLAVLADGYQLEGSHRITVDASGWASGMYLLRLRTVGGTLTLKMMLVR
jgi:hypothetical protein